MTTVHTDVPLEPMNREGNRTVEILPQTQAEAVALPAVPTRAAAGRVRESPVQLGAVPGVIGVRLPLPGAAIPAIDQLVPSTLDPGTRAHRVRTAPVHRAPVVVLAKIAARVQGEPLLVHGRARTVHALAIVPVVRAVAARVAGVAVVIVPVVIVRVVWAVVVSVGVRIAVAMIGAVRALIGRSAELTRLTFRKRSWPRNSTRTPGVA